jgi:hypothetical protein
VLLGPVVQIPLDPSAGVVRGGDDPCPRCGQLAARFCVGDRGGDQLGEFCEPGLGAGGQALLAAEDPS